MMIKPKFRQDLVVTYHQGTSDVALKDPISDSFYRLSAYEYRFLKALDGKHSLEEILSNLKEKGAYYSPRNAGLIISKASQYGLILGLGSSARQMRKAVKQNAEQAKRVKMFSSVYFLFIPIFNPDRFLERTLWIFDLLVNRFTKTLIALLAPIAVYLVIIGADRIANEYLYFFNLRNLFYLWIVIFITKLVHEFSHAYTAKRLGLHVPEMGVAFLIFFPCLYCNTTDAWGLADRKERIAISAAGIISEASLAILATFIWYYSRPGIVNSLAFYLMAISFVSTVLFNGNPLLKFDGYFILIDWLKIPNLAFKSIGHIKYLFLNRVLGAQSVESPARNSKETFIFSLYGVCSFLYRISLYTGIVIGVYFRFDKVLGLVLAVLAIALFVVRPLFRGLKTLHSMRGSIKPRFTGVLSLLAIILFVGLALFTPWSRSSVFLCYLDAAKKQALAVPMKTSVDEVFIKEGSKVDKGDTLFTLNTQTLKHSLDQALGEKRIISKEINFMLVDEKRFADAGKKVVELLHVDDEIEKINQELHLATEEIVAEFPGVITTLDYRMSHGFQPGAGVVVGELESHDTYVVHGLIPAEDLHKITKGMDAQVWLPIKTGLDFQTRILSIRPYSEKELKNSPFSSRFGGELATEQTESEDVDKPLEAYFQCSAHIKIPRGDSYLGMTGRLKVDSKPRSIAQSVFRKVATIFNRESLF